MSRVLVHTTLPKFPDAEEEGWSLGLKQNFSQFSGETLGTWKEHRPGESAGPGLWEEALRLTVFQHCPLWDGTSAGSLYSGCSSRTFHVGSLSFSPYLRMLLGNLKR